jgi:hypothetical protein
MPTRAPAEPRGRVVLPPLASDELAAAALAPPRLPAAAAAVVPLAERAGATATPVLLAVPEAAGRLLLARALHARAARPGPLVAVTGRRPALDGLPPGAALYVDVAALAPETRLALEALLDDGETWVLAAAEPGAALPRPLAARLAGVVLAVPPLAARPADVPALADAALARLARRGGGRPLALTPPARARLAAHDWPGDVAELEAALARAALRAATGVIDAADLDGALAPPPTVRVEAALAPAPADGGLAAPDGAALEFVLAELAHELRNPMVTIKTYAEHLPALLEDAALRARFATLTNEAITRMDALLDNLLAFARLGPPRAEPIDVDALVARVLAEVEPALEGRTIRLARAAAPARCAADPEHLAYALRNLFTGVVREVPAREELVADATVNGVVTLRFAGSAAALDRLRRLAAPAGADERAMTLADPTLLPLAFRLARAVLERNGGSLTVTTDGAGTTTLVVGLPGEDGRRT